jgi:hypothetical protein
MTGTCVDFWLIIMTKLEPLAFTRALVSLTPMSRAGSRPSLDNPEIRSRLAMIKNGRMRVMKQKKRTSLETIIGYLFTSRRCAGISSEAEMYIPAISLAVVYAEAAGRCGYKRGYLSGGDWILPHLQDFAAYSSNYVHQRPAEKKSRVRKLD